jgi:DNA/RNA-binding domain of Phe-tRNA-synthetase-like protein
MPLTLTAAEELDRLHIVALEIEQVQVVPSSVRLSLWSDEAAQHAVEHSRTREAEQLRNSVRKLLRHGKFKASGRSKPAQEYLLRCALEEGSLPRINAPVDVLNTASLVGGLPISLLSLTKCSPDLHIRRGRAGEGYVFNSSGQVLDVEDLIVTCDASQTPERPVGSPVKDSMAGKIEADDTSLVAIIYAPLDSAGVAAANLTAQVLADNMVEFCEARLGELLRLPN